MIVSQQVIAKTFKTKNGAGILKDADATPVVRVHINGVDTMAASVTHEGTATYKASVTLPVLALNDQVQLFATWLCGGLSLGDTLIDESCVYAGAATGSAGISWIGGVGMTYTVSDIAAVRLMIRDKTTRVNQTTGVESTVIPLFTDTEIAYALSSEGDVYAAAAFCLESLCADAAKVAKAQSSGVFSSSKDPIVTALMNLAARYRERSMTEPASANVEPRTFPWEPLDRDFGSDALYEY